MPQQRLFVTALRVLSRFTQCQDSAARDINAVRRAALPDERDLPIDALCCQIIRRLLAQRRPELRRVA